MFKLILGRAGTGKTTAVLSRLTKAGQRRKQVLIVPEQQSHEAERALCRAGGDRVSLYAEVLSFSRLANRVFLAAGGRGAPERGGGRSEFAQRPGIDRCRPAAGARVGPCAAQAAYSAHDHRGLHPA